MSSRIKEVRKSEGLYDVILLVSYGGKDYEVCLHKISQNVAKAETCMSGNYIMIRLINERNEGFASCCIHVKHLESGCMECSSLLLPPKSGCGDT
ncbi:MAG: hypothetical protein QXS42_07260 [Zestosphaera sp.]